MNYKIKKGLIEKRIDEGTFILTPKGEKLFTLNSTAAFIWDCLKDKKPHSYIAKRLASIYDVEEEKAEKDLDVFMDDLKKCPSELIKFSR